MKTKTPFPAGGLARIFLVRHGVAEDGHPAGDEARTLTSEGRIAFRDFSRSLKDQLQGAHGLVGIATSPLVRAVQTAEILAEAWGITAVRSEAALAAEVATPGALTTLARKLGAGWAFVGHNPSFGMTLGSWLGINQHAVRFRKGAICALTVPASAAPPYELVFMAAPGRKTITSVAGITGS